MRRVPILLVAIAVVSVTLVAQTPANPSFETASVKPNVSGIYEIPPRWRAVGEQFTATNQPLINIIAFAYQLQMPSVGGPRRPDERLLDLPEWARTERYDVVAKAPGGTKLALPQNLMMPNGEEPSMVALMLRRLLGDRFHLKVHGEAREVAVYALVMARPDRKPGSGLVECDTLPDPKRCGLRMPGAELRGVGTSIAQLGDFLSIVQLQRPVIDRTQLTGRYDITLDYFRDQGPRAGPVTGAPPPPINPNAPSLTVALQEQLGLKLESMKAPVDFLVIDHVERPSEN